MAEISSRMLLLNGTRFNHESIRERILCINKGSHPEMDVLTQEVFLFLEKWLNDDPFITQQTSGSTGTPKQIRIKKEFMLNSAIMTGDYFGLRQGMTALLCLSPDFIAGKMMVLRSMVFKMNLITTSTESNPINNLEVDIDFAAMVPLQVAMILKKNPEKLDLIKTLIIGGGPLSKSLEESLQSKSTKCWHTYGMTETVSHIALRPINGIDRSQWFDPLPGVNVSLDRRGCLAVNAPLLSDDVVITNDLAELNGQKFQITGRIDDVIISAGLKLHPAIIEKKLEALIHFPFFIAGEDHPDAGQIVVLYIEADKDQFNLSSFKKTLESTLEPYEIPRKILMGSGFRYLGSGKIDRKATVREFLHN